MSKKSILSTLLISSALLGAVSANAATSAVKPESKLVTVSKDGAKIYKNSKLQESKKAKKGTVYKVDGYRNINGKHYYRVYQQDSKNKTVYRGYLLNKDTKELKAQKVDKKDRFVALTKDDQAAWKNLYFNTKIKTYNGTKHSSNFEVKRTYEINGKKYFSLYRNDQWMGYMDGSAFQVLTPEKVDKEKQNYEVVKEYDTYNDFFFTINGALTKGDKVTVKRIYTFGTGRKYGSVYNKDDQWIGYANMNALKVVESSTPEKPSEPDTPVKPDQPGTGGDNKPGGDQDGSGSGDTGNKPGDGGTGDSGSGNQPGDGDQSGNPGTGGDQPSQPGQPTESELDKAKKEAKEAIDKAEKALQSNNTEASKKVVEEALNTLKKTIMGTDVNAIKKATEDLNKAVSVLKPTASSTDITALQNTIKDAEQIMNYKANLNNTGSVQNALDLAKPTLEAAKNNNSSPEQVEKAIKTLKDAIKEVSINNTNLIKAIQDVKDLASKVYITKEEQEKLEDAEQKAGAVAKNTILNSENYNSIQSAEKQMEVAKKGLEAQPNQADGGKLNQALKDYKSLQDFITNSNENNADKNGEILFDNYKSVEEAAKKAKDVMSELAKDKVNHNEATKNLTAKDVQSASGKLIQAITSLKVNKTTFEEYCTKEKEIIDSINCSDATEVKQKANNMLNTLKETVNQNSSIDNYEKILQLAKSLQTFVNEHKAHKEEEKTVPVEGTKGKTGCELVKAIQSELNNGQYENEDVVKNLCKELEAYYAIVGLNSNNGDVAVSGHNGLVNNSSMTDLFKDAPAAEKLIQDYAKNTNSVNDRLLEEAKYNLEKDIKGLKKLNKLS